MLEWVRNGTAWRIKKWKRWAFLITRFRNGFALASAYRKRLPAGKAILWDGTTLHHPANRMGLTETILEIWFDQVYTSAFYQPQVGDVVIDAGANVGLFSVWLARRYPYVQIVGFEPCLENFQLLERNCQEAQVKNVTPIQAALGGQTTKGIMEYVSGRSLDHRLKPVYSGEGTIPVYSLADALAISAAPRIALLKMDIEGSEYEVFQRASPSDVARIDRYAIEYHEHLRPGVVNTIKQVLMPTHDVSIVTHHSHYGMRYAARKA